MATVTHDLRTPLNGMICMLCKKIIPSDQTKIFFQKKDKIKKKSFLKFIIILYININRGT
jgi:hypothetical protein